MDVITVFTVATVSTLVSYAVGVVKGRKNAGIILEEIARDARGALAIDTIIGCT